MSKVEVEFFERDFPWGEFIRVIVHTTIPRKVVTDGCHLDDLKQHMDETMAQYIYDFVNKLKDAKASDGGAQ